MTNKRYLLSSMGMVGALAFASLIAAQQPKTSSGSASTQQGQGTMMSGDMMKMCREHCQSTTASIEQLKKNMQQARQSNEPAKMRAALEAAEKPLNEMSEHMRMCMNMMNMKGMQGGMGGMMQPGKEAGGK